MSQKSTSILRYLANRAGDDHHSRHHYDSHGDYRDHNKWHYGYRQLHDHESMAGPVPKMGRAFLDWLRRKKRVAFVIVMGLLATGLILTAALVWLGVKLLGLAGPLLSEINSNGLKGVVNDVINFITRVWEGSGK